MTDPLGRGVGYECDAAGRVTRKTFPDSRAIGFAYDANGSLASITPPSRPGHAFSYTPVDLQLQYSPTAVNGVAKPRHAVRLQPGQAAHYHRAARRTAGEVWLRRRRVFVNHHSAAGRHVVLVPTKNRSGVPKGH